MRQSCFLIFQGKINKNKSFAPKKNIIENSSIDLEDKKKQKKLCLFFFPVFE